MNPRHFQPWTLCNELRAHIETIFRRNQVPKTGRDYVMHTMAQGPARPVQARNGGTCVRHYARKMHATMMVESRSGESVLAWMLENDESVHAYFAQPARVTLAVHRPDGIVATTVPYTPDFLVIENDRICLKEVRDNARFLADNKRSPERYFRDATGRYRNIPAERHFESLGLSYELVVISDLPTLLVENVKFLEDYLQEQVPPLTEEERQAVVQKVETERWVPLRALLTSGIQADSIYKAIAEGAIHSPLETMRLSDTDGAKLFTDRATAQTHALIAALDAKPPPPIPGTLMLRAGSTLSIYDHEYDVLLQGERDVLLRDQLGVTVSRSVDEIRLLHASGDAVGEAFRLPTDRLALWAFPAPKVEKAMRKLRAARDPHQTDYSDRHITRIRSQVEGAANDLEAIELLLDEEHKRGNRNSHLTEASEEQLQKAIDEHFNTPDRPTAKGAHEKYVKALEGLEEPGGGPMRPVSLQTFTRRCKERMSVKAREGKRADYQKSRIVPFLTNENPAHGVRPHEVLYIDHTPADIETRSPQGKLLRKPTVTAAVDGCTRHVRAFVLLYEPASVRAVMLLIRTYIDRYGRVPRVIVVDNGKEFHSHELEFLCRTYGIEIRYRAPGMPRGGALIERTFGAINEEVLSELEGNSRAMKKDTRLITGDMQPMKRASWTLTALHGVISKYLYEEHATRVHPELGMSPDAYEEQRVAETGAREHMLFKLDENAMLLTSPHPQRRAKRKVVKGRGVNVYGIYYQHPAMQNVRPGTSVEVRVEWWNASVVYVLINGRWVTAIGNSARFLSERGNREVEMAYRTHVRQAREDARKDGKKREGTSFRNVKLRPEHFDPLLAEQQSEVRRLYQSLGALGATAMPLPRGVPANDSGAAASHSTGAVPAQTSAPVMASPAGAPSAAPATGAPVAPSSTVAGAITGVPVACPANDSYEDDDLPNASGASFGLR